MKFIEALEVEAVEQLAEIRAYRAGTADGEMRQRAKTALGVIGAYVRLRATLANERSNDLIERRLLGGAEPLALSVGEPS